MTDFDVKRGDTLDFDIGPILKADGTVQDITGYTVTFTAKDRLGDADPGVFQVSGTIVNGPAGLARVVIPPSSTNGFTTDRVLYYDVQIRDGGGATKTIDSGKLRVKRDVTRT